MSPRRKPRGDSTLDRLPDAQREALCDWITPPQNLTYQQARERLAAEFGVSTSESSLARFFRLVAVPRHYARARDEAETWGQLVEGNFDAPTIKRVKQLAFSALTEQTPDVSTAKALLKIVGDSAKVEIAKERVALDSRKVALLEKKAAQADAATAAMQDTTLTPAQREQAVKDALGIK